MRQRFPTLVGIKQTPSLSCCRACKRQKEIKEFLIWATETICDHILRFALVLMWRNSSSLESSPLLLEMWELCCHTLYPQNKASFPSPSLWKTNRDHCQNSGWGGKGSETLGNESLSTLYYFQGWVGQPQGSWSPKEKFPEEEWEMQQIKILISVFVDTL